MKISQSKAATASQELKVVAQLLQSHLIWSFILYFKSSILLGLPSQLNHAQ